MIENNICTSPKVKERYDTILAIVKRAQKMGIAQGSRATQFMDIDNCKPELRLKSFLEADDLNFAHDFCGIQNNIDRVTGRMMNRFVPRFAKWN